MTNKESLVDQKKSALLRWIDTPDSEVPPLSKGCRYFLRLIWITCRQFNNNELSLRSGALTYTILLALVPMIAMSTAVVKGLGGGDHLREVAYSYIETLDNGQTGQEESKRDESGENELEQASGNENLTSHLRSAVDKLFDYVDRTNFATLGSFGVVGILLSVLLVLSHIESAMNAIWRVPSGRSPLRKIADYLTLLILFPISVNVAFAAGAFLKTPSLAAKIDIFIPFEWIQTLLLQAVPIFSITLTFYAIYIFFPNTKVKPLPAVIGATLAALLWFGVQNFYITLQIGVSKYNAIYGSFATLPLFLVWMYLGWLFILTGAQLSFAFQNIDTFRLQPINSAPSLRLGAAFDVMDEIYRSFDNDQKLTPGLLPSSLSHYPQRLIDDILTELLRAQKVHISSTDDILLPATPYKNYDRESIVRLILGEDTPETSGGRRSRKAIDAAGVSSRSAEEETTNERSL